MMSQEVIAAFNKNSHYISRHMSMSKYLDLLVEYKIENQGSDHATRNELAKRLALAGVIL